MVEEETLYFDKTVSFADLGLERRLTRALENKKFLFPSNVQAKGIPIVLQKKDVLMRAKTGSGKTLAYLLPLVQLLLQGCQEAEAGIKAVILVPSNELVYQVWKTLKKEVLKFSNDVISLLPLRAERGMNTQASRLKEGPNIVVSTPTRLAKHLKNKSVELNQLQHLVVDEADLILSFGYFDDVQTVVSSLPKNYHCVLVSATLTTNLSELQKLVITDPDPKVVLVNDGVNEKDALLQEFHLKLENNETKLLVLFTLIKLELLKGKMLIFTNHLNRCYELKLFLEQFSISSAVFDHSHPSNCRQSILNQFNQGIFDILIVTDDGMNVDKEFMLISPVEDEPDPKEEGPETISEGEPKPKEEGPETIAEAEPEPKEEGPETIAKDEPEPKEEGPETTAKDEPEPKEEAATIAEHEPDPMKEAPVDQNLRSADQTILKQDTPQEKEETEEPKKEPPSVDLENEKYIVPSTEDDPTSNKQEGKPPANRERTAPKDKSTSSRGIDFREVTAVVNFDFPNSVKAYTHRVGRTARGGRFGTALSLWTPRDVEVMKRLKEFQTIHSPTHKANIKPLDFDLQEIIGFKIRVQIAIRNVTRNAVKEARLKELKRQMLKSDKLKAYFENNPREATLLTLKHDNKPTIKVDKLLAHIPSYILGDRTIVEVPNSTRNFQALGASTEYPGQRKKRIYHRRRRGRNPLRRKRRKVKH